MCPDRRSDVFPGSYPRPIGGGVREVARWTNTFFLSSKRNCTPSAVLERRRGQLRDALETRRGGYGVWSEIQSILVAAGNASKLLWGSSRGKEEERELLREAAGVADDSPLKSRKIRNAFEHIDERLEDWSEQSATATSVSAT
jgi:hypothetical protein